MVSQCLNMHAGDTTGGQRTADSVRELTDRQQQGVILNHRARNRTDKSTTVAAAQHLLTKQEKAYPLL